MAILNPIASTSVKIEASLDQIHLLKTYQFQLGDELMVYDPLAQSTQPENVVLSLIIEGQVRVLCKQTFQKREITALLLQAGETFGADHLFQTMLLPYRVVAASQCQIVQIPVAQLTGIFHQIPLLHQQIMQQIREREQLIFFKSLTQLGSLPHHQIQKYVLNRLVQQSIKSGESLIQTVDGNGYCWLRTGQIQAPDPSVSLPMIGGGWIYPNPDLLRWVATTDLLLYKLPIHSWELAELLNLL